MPKTKRVNHHRLNEKETKRGGMEKNKKQFVTFEILEEKYGLPMCQIKEIIRPKRITHVPNTDEYVLGVINLRGQIVPVINLKSRLNLKEGRQTDRGEERIIIAEINDVLTGINVEEVKEVVWLDENTIDPPPKVAGGVKREYLTGVAQNEDELLVMVDLKALLFGEQNTGDTPEKLEE